MNKRRKILFVNNNMKIGGVQKALVEVLWAIHRDYDVTLLLFCKTGVLLDRIPDDVRVIGTASDFRYLGMSQKECRRGREYRTRACYTLLSRTMGMSRVTGLMGHTVGDDDPESYDYAISFLHCAREKSLYGGTAEYVLNHVSARRKACYIHCDYLHSGTCSEYSKRIYRRYDQIICVSGSVRKRFLELLPELSGRMAVVENPLDAQKLRTMAAEAPFDYDPGQLNVLTVARLAPEKGIDRIIRAMPQVSGFRYFVVGPGALQESLVRMIRDHGLEQRVFLLGEDSNPYRYMAGADVLAVPSRHEAAPVVFQEAAVLGVPVLTTRTLSAEEMVPPERGMVIDNTDEAIAAALRQLAEHPDSVRRWKWDPSEVPDAAAAFRVQFHDLVSGNNEQEEKGERTCIHS